MERSFFGTWLQRRAVALSMPIVNPAETRVICLGAIRPSAPVVGVLMEDRIETFPHAVFARPPALNSCNDLLNKSFGR